MWQIAEQIGMVYREVPDSGHVAQPVNDFLFPWEEEGSVENPITIQKDEGLSEQSTQVSKPPGEPPLIETKPVCASLRTSKIQRTQLVDSFLICK